MYDVAAYQRERIRELSREVRGLEALRDQLVRVLAGVVVDYEARLWVDALSQDEFMCELALESDRFTSRPVGHLELVSKPLIKSHGPSSSNGKIAVRLRDRDSREEA